MKKLLFLFGVVGVVFLCFVFLYYFSPMQPVTTQYAQKNIHVGATTLVVDVADTEALREKGLSGRTSLAAGKGMLFVFNEDDQWGIWMKDMKFSIDILWLAADGTVVTVVPGAAPDSYPQAFYPTKPARYVVEVPAGYAGEHGIAEGAKFVLQ
jgi:uncharacterized membrane protein (UPF0127 family)